MKGHFWLAALSLVAGFLLLGGTTRGEEPPPTSWNERARKLALSIEPGLVLSDSLTATARGIADAYDEPSSRARALLEHVVGEYSNCPTTKSPPIPFGPGATAIHDDGCGSKFDRLILAVALMRAAGLQAYLAGATCSPWTGPATLSFDDWLLPTWRLPGGDYVLPDRNMGDIEEFAPPPCPWGQWLPLAPAMARPRPLPAPQGAANIWSLDLDNVGLESLVDNDGLTPGLRGLTDEVETRVKQSLTTGWPRHFKLRERWPDNDNCNRVLHLRLRTPGGFLAATLQRQGDTTTLAVDLRIVSPLSLAGAQIHIAPIIEALTSLRCTTETIPSAERIVYDEITSSLTHGKADQGSPQQEK